MEPSTKSNLHNRHNQLLHQEAVQSQTETSVPAESFAHPEYHGGDAQTPHTKLSSLLALTFSLMPESPGALLVLVAHNDVFFIGTEQWAQAARIRVKVYSVLWNVH